MAQNNSDAAAASASASADPADTSLCLVAKGGEELKVKKSTVSCLGFVAGLLECAWVYIENAISDINILTFLFQSVQLVKKCII